MPRRYADYLPAYEPLNQLSTIGSWLIGAGFLLALFTFIHALLKGPKAGDNPWGARTLEWQTSSPPPHENFKTTPQVTTGPYHYGD